MSLLKLYVCEFITGGGLSDAPLPISLAQEGLMMRDALLSDIAKLNCYEMITSSDFRLNASPLVSQNWPVEAGQFDVVFNQLLKEVDIVWLIAPETDGVLLSLSERCYEKAGDENVVAEKKLKFIGCGYEAMLIGTSKSLCAEALNTANIFTLPVIAGDEWIGARSKKIQQLIDAHAVWVAKPEDGAGCEGIKIFDDLSLLDVWLKVDQRYLNYLLQPFQTGIHASFSMLCNAGKAWLLSANQQHIIQENQTFKLEGITMNALPKYWQRFETLARKIANMLPDAKGYLGVDVVIDTSDDKTNADKIYVIEINPRLTTSYVGLSEAIGHNAAQLILDCVLNPTFKCPTLQKNKVEISW